MTESLANTGNRSKRGSAERIVDLLERDDLAHGRKPEFSSAARRAGMLVRTLRKAKGFSQAALADKIGVSQARISEIEAGMGPQGPSWAVIERIASACNGTILMQPTSSDYAIDAGAPEDPSLWRRVGAAA